MSTQVPLQGQYFDRHKQWMHVFNFFTGFHLNQVKIASIVQTYDTVGPPCHAKVSWGLNLLLVSARDVFGHIESVKS
jgi:hypothetical protein